MGYSQHFITTIWRFGDGYPIKKHHTHSITPGGDIHLAAKAGDINAVRQIQRAKPHSVHMADETGGGYGFEFEGMLMGIHWVLGAFIVFFVGMNVNIILNTLKKPCFFLVVGNIITYLALLRRCVKKI